MIEVYPITFEDLVGMHVVEHVFVGSALPCTELALARMYGRRQYERWYPKGATGYGDYLEDEVDDIRWSYLYLTLVTCEGRFTFKVQKPHRGITVVPFRGIWETGVEHPPGLGIPVMLRITGDHPTWRRMYAVDERTGLVVLEFGALTRADDPNLRFDIEGVFRWEDGQGWESPLLDPVPEVEGVEIVRSFARPTPKVVGGGVCGSRKGRGYWR